MPETLSTTVTIHHPAESMTSTIRVQLGDDDAGRTYEVPTSIINEFLGPDFNMAVAIFGTVVEDNEPSAEVLEQVEAAQARLLGDTGTGIVDEVA